MTKAAKYLFGAVNVDEMPTQTYSQKVRRWSKTSAGGFLAVLLVAITGCGTGGYIGGGIISISRQAATIDAGQSIPVTASVSPGLVLDWAVSGASCSAASCGSVSAATGLTTTYLAPAGLTAPISVVLTAKIPGTSDSDVVNITVNPDPVISGTPPAGTVGVAYSTTLTSSGGTAPSTFLMSSGALPAGLSFNASTGIISGTPTTVGSSTAVFSLTDSSNVPYTVTASEVISIGTAVSTVVTVSGAPSAGVVGTAYSSTLAASGGTAPYTWSVTSGALPGGLTLGAATGIISGTPTASGSFTFTAQAVDSKGVHGSATFTVAVSAAIAPLSLTSGTLPSGTVNVPYSSTIGLTGGTSPYTCSITSGTLPAGLALGANCLVSGTPTTPGTTTVTVKATDSSNPTLSTTGPETIVINPGAAVLTIASPPPATVGIPYTGTVVVTGGTGPYTCAITAGTLPAGLTLGANCVVTGTPTAPGTVTVTVKGTDSSNPPNTGSGPVTITVGPAALSLTTGTLPNGTVGVVYSSTIGVTGGTAPYSCAITAGTLPAGLTLGASCLVSGTPTAPGTTTVTVKATDSANPALTTTGPETITINAGNPTLTLTAPPPATVGVPYTGTIVASGGTAPYTCVLAGGTLPAGLVLGANCIITGTPTTPGPVTVTVTATGTGTNGGTVTGPVTITVNPVPPLTFTGSLPNATLGVAYTQTLQAAGGVGPYTYAVTAGALPPGITLTSTGVVSGVPTAVGASSFTVTATDSESTPQTAGLPLVLLVVYPTTPNDGELKGPYAFLFQGYDDALAGVLSYQTATAGSFNADGTGVVALGELDSNHQYSTPTGATIATQTFLGTYTIGTDNRGFLAITTLYPNGTVNHTAIYAISVHAVVAPATISTSGSLIEYDTDQLAGTRGSGTFLAQTPAAVAAGLTGSYAFGLQGDTPCLPACTVGLTPGPVASVGRFTTGGGVLSAGTGDANIAATNLPNLGLNGSYGAADGNGRVQLAMATTGTIAGFYPQDYAVYVVDANHAFIISTDKHSSYILLAGTAQAQTTAVFTGASLSGPYVGYENSISNPGLVVGETLQGVLNFSTATIFRGTADGVSSCNTTNVDVAGLTALLNGLTGLGSGVPLLNDLLGTYQSTGPSTCMIAASGRGVLNYPVPNSILSFALGLLGISATPPPPRILYLAGQDQGYFLETGYAGLGNIEMQVGAPFSVATLNGTYVYGTSPAASAASINSSGIFMADGLGHATTLLDMNVGVGTINVLELGVTGTYNYSLTDATAGRYTLGTNVLYAITPTRYVLVDTNALTTSPSVSLIY